MHNLFAKGRFAPINERFIKESIIQLKGLAAIQAKYRKGDMDTLLNELHDSIVGKYLGFELVNTEKHGFDCKLNKAQDIFLESKTVSYLSNSWNATFNDTTMEKADAFRDKKVWLALSLWQNASDLLCICFGQNKKIGDLLEDGVKKHQAGKTVRSTQSISFSKLVFDLHFKILSPSLPAEILMQRLHQQKHLKQLTAEFVIEYKDFVSINSCF